MTKCIASRGASLVSRFCAFILLALTGSNLHAADSIISSFSISNSQNNGGGAMAGATGEQLNNITQLIWGPGMYLLMAIGAIVAIFGWIKGSKEVLFTGVGVFILAALLRSLVPIFMNS